MNYSAGAAARDAACDGAGLLASVIGSHRCEGIEISIGNEDLAGGAQLTVPTTSRLLQKWERAGILKKGRGRIVLLRPDELKRVAAKS